MLAKDIRLRVMAGSARWCSRWPRVTFSWVTPMGAEKPVGNHWSHTAKIKSSNRPSQKVGMEEIR